MTYVQPTFPSCSKQLVLGSIFMATLFMGSSMVSSSASADARCSWDGISINKGKGGEAKEAKKGHYHRTGAHFLSTNPPKKFVDGDGTTRYIWHYFADNDSRRNNRFGSDKKDTYLGSVNCKDKYNY